MIFKTDVTWFKGYVFKKIGEHVINTDRINLYSDKDGSSSNITYVDRVNDRRSIPVPATIDSTMAEIETAYDSVLSGSKMILPIFPNNDISQSPINQYVSYSDFIFSYPDSKDPSYSWVTFMDGFLMSKVLVDNSSDELVIAASPTPEGITMVYPSSGLFGVYLAGSGDVDIYWGMEAVDSETLGGTTLYEHTFSGTNNTITITNPANVTLLSQSAYDISSAAIPAGAANIQNINLSNNSITELETHAEWVDIETIYVHVTSIASFETHAEWTLLKSLTVDYAPLTAITLRSEWDQLENLNIQNTSVSSITTHASWVNMNTFNVSFTSISAITTHAEWIALETFYTKDTSITTIVGHAEWVLMEDYDASANAITVTPINNLMIALNATGMSNGFIFIDEGTNAAPTGAGATAVSNLEGRGNLVFTN